MADNCKGKSWWEPGGIFCKGKDAAEDGVGDIISGQMKEFAQSITDMVMGIMKWFNTWWMSVPGPDLESGAVTQVTTDLSWYTAAFAIIGLLFALVRLVMSQDFKTLISNGLQPIVNLIIVTACYATGLTLVIEAGDEFSKWILTRATTGLEIGCRYLSARCPWSQLGYWRLDPIWLARTHRLGHERGVHAVPQRHDDGADGISTHACSRIRHRIRQTSVLQSQRLPAGLRSVQACRSRHIRPWAEIREFPSRRQGQCRRSDSGRDCVY